MTNVKATSVATEDGKSVVIALEFDEVIRRVVQGERLNDWLVTEIWRNGATRGPIAISVDSIVSLRRASA